MKLLLDTESPDILTQNHFVDASKLVGEVAGMKFRLLRKIRGLTQSQVAQNAGVSQADVSRSETHTGSVRLATLIRIAEEYGVSLAALAEAESITVAQNSLHCLGPKDIVLYSDLGILDIAK